MQLLAFKSSIAYILLASRVAVGGPLNSAFSSMLAVNGSMASTAAGPTIDMPARYVWSLVFDYDNSGNTGSIVQSYEIVESGSYTSQTFNEALASETKKLAESGSIQVESGASFGPFSASVKAGYESSKEVNNFLQTTTREQIDRTTSYSRTEIRNYTIGPRSRLVLYQRIFQGPGMSVQDSTFKATPKPLPRNQLQEDILITLGLTQRNFVKKLTVVYGDRASDAPAERVRDWFHGSDDINAKFGGKQVYVWLVPEWTTQVSEALTLFDLVIQRQPDWRYSDLAADTGGDYRYLIPVKKRNDNLLISDLTLARSDTFISNLPSIIWRDLPQGATHDINRGRNGDYLYLVWQLQRAYPV